MEPMVDRAFLRQAGFDTLPPAPGDKGREALLRHWPTVASIAVSSRTRVEVDVSIRHDGLTAVAVRHPDDAGGREILREQAGLSQRRLLALLYFFGIPAVVLPETHPCR